MFLLTTFVLSLAAVSAASLSSSNIVIPTSVNHDDGSFVVTFDLKNDGVDTTIDWSSSEMTQGTATFNLPATTLTSGETKSITATVTFSQYQTGKLIGSIIADPSGVGGSEDVDFTVNLAESTAFTVTDSKISATDTKATITIENTGNDQLSNINLNIVEVNDITFQANVAEFNILGPLQGGESRDVDITVSASDSLDLGKQIATFTVTFGTTSQEGTITIEQDYCELGEQGSWISIKKVDDEKKDNDNEWEWKPLDDIEIIIKLENAGYDDKTKGKIEYGLYDSNDNDFLIEEEIDFSIKEDEEEEYTIEFTIDPKDLSDDTGDNDYVFYVKVYDDDDADEETQCKQFTQDVEIKRNADEITLEPAEIIIPSEPECGSQIELITELINIGTEDQDDISVSLYNSELGINILKDIGNIDVAKGEDVKFAFTIPADAEAKLYDFEITIFDEDGDVYELEDHDGDDNDAKFYRSINIKGNCIVAPQASVNAVLDSDAKSGKLLTIKSTIKNTGSEQETYTLEAADYNTWANLRDINPKVIVLEAGESADVTYKLNVNKDVSGSQTFNIVVKTGDSEKESMKQLVSVTIEESKGFSFPGLTGNSVEGENNWYLWGIGLLNVILIVIIIIVAVRVARS